MAKKSINQLDPLSSTRRYFICITCLNNLITRPNHIFQELVETSIIDPIALTVSIVLLPPPTILTFLIINLIINPYVYYTLPQQLSPTIVYPTQIFECIFSVATMIIYTLEVYFRGELDKSEGIITNKRVTGFQSPSLLQV